MVSDGAELAGTILRVRGQLDLTCVLDSTDAGVMRRTICERFESLRTQVRSASCVLALGHGPVVIWPNPSARVSPEGLTADTPTQQLLHWTQSEEQESVGKKSGKKNRGRGSAPSVINLHLLMEVTSTAPVSAPVLSRSVHSSHFLSAALPVDCAVWTGGHDTIRDSCRRLVEALTHQLTDMEAMTLRHIKGPKLLLPEPLHFLLPEPRGLVALVYPQGLTDQQLHTQRQELHRRFDLPEDRPYFRRANAFHFPDEPYRDGYLRNPHLVLTNPTLDGGQVHLVQGTYSYHHYLQERVDDSGWGCAYRSLQTICSWFRQQGYTDRAVPTHTQIQQALVDVGDKPSSFVGSRQWIGSIEVQVVLDHLLGVTSKIMFVSQGAELASKGRELANHFHTQGTPVMIGGGVLAHTILGVTWSESSGQIRFLILDPHYTGAEDLQVVTDKGWCGWKGPEFWDQTAYYNLCLPQRSKII